MIKCKIDPILIKKQDISKRSISAADRLWVETMIKNGHEARKTLRDFSNMVMTDAEKYFGILKTLDKK